MQVFNARVEYAVRAVSELATRESEGPVQSREIAQRQAIPEAFLDQLLSTLRRAGVIRSIRGPSGGYVLNRRPQQITLGDVVRACNGEECFSSPPPAEGAAAPSCTMARVVRDVRERVERAVAQILDEITIRDLLDQRLRLEEAQATMFHI
jgi:Rrf2 family transcriptional regulator, cysteine metabolism repressor